MFRQGFAKTQFVERYQCTPWRIKPGGPCHSKFPYLDLLLQRQQLLYVDYLLVHTLLQNHPEASENSALFLLHLILSSKDGHLCICIENTTCSPPVEQLWFSQEGALLEPQEAQKVTDYILQGAKELPQELICSDAAEINDMMARLIFKEKNCYYLQKNWIFETRFLQSLSKHLSCPPTLQIDTCKALDHLKMLCEKNLLLKEQSEAIIAALCHPFTLITGGPGRGKTYTAGHLIQTFWNHLSAHERSTCKIALAAPTGKAAANLQKSLSKLTEDIEGFPLIEAKTLHSLLNISHRSSYDDEIRLNADLLIVDESSMIDAQIMSRLFSSLKQGSRLVLLGDNHQLPSVEAGALFADLINENEIHDPQSLFPIKKIQVKTLSKSLRTDRQQLIDFAQLINEGNAERVLEMLNTLTTTEIKRLLFSNDPFICAKELIAYTAEHFPLMVDKDLSSCDILKMFQTLRLLSPHKKGLLGFEHLNQSIWQYLIKKLPRKGVIAIPIIITSNDYTQHLFNGETGVLVRHLPLQPFNPQDYALFADRYSNSTTRKLFIYQLPSYEFAYCLSVHKSQGSEFERIILALPEGSEHFGREVFYTAITRAKKQIEIYGSDYTINQTIQRQAIRLSGIKYRLPSYLSQNH